jgi:hypothetical protein
LHATAASLCCLSVFERRCQSHRTEIANPPEMRPTRALIGRIRQTTFAA